MESPKVTINTFIILRHLKVLELDGKRMERFKETLCQQTPTRGAGRIKMEDLIDKNIDEIVDVIFRCHTERHGASTIKKVLKEMRENQIKLSIERDLRNASKTNKIMESQINEALQSFNMETEKTEAAQCSKNMETEKAEATQCSKNMENENNEDFKWMDNMETEKTEAAQCSKSMETEKAEATQCSKNMETENNEASPWIDNMETEKTEAAQCSKNMETEKPEATQCSKNMETEKNEAKASKSKVINVKQDVNQEYKIAAITLVPVCDAAPCSETPAKNIKTEQAEDAVPGPSNHKEATASKNEAHSPVQKPLKQEPQPQISLGQGDIANIISHTLPNKQFGVTPSHISSKGPSQSRKSLPNTRMEKEIGNIMATHLKTLGEEGILGFQYFLCLIEPPFSGSKIQMKDIKDRSVEDMVELIISHHTLEHAQATVEKVLDRMDKTEIKKLIVDGISKSLAVTSLPIKKQAKIAKILKELSVGKWKQFKMTLCNMKPPGEAEEITMENLNGKLRKQVVELIFKCYNEKLGTEKILWLLKHLKEPKIRSRIQKIIREGSSQSGKSLPITSMKKRTSKIMTTHLEKLGEEGIVGFKYFLCLIEPPFSGSKIQMKDIKDKSVEDMVDLIISHHTVKHAQATVEEVLDRMGKTEIKKLIVDGISKCSATTSLNVKNQAIITKYLKMLSRGKWEKFKTALCNMKPPGETEKIKMKNLYRKLKERIVALIFKRFNEKLGTEKILEILKNLKEFKIRRKMQRKLKEGDAKKIRKQGKDVPGKSHNTEQNADTMGGPSPAQEQPKT
ncbi:uncharacterized protein LOC143923526 isoform X5 [Lithobates pipiens]